MRTKVAEMLGVEFPICAFSHCRDVVAAVSNAGGFGILGAVAHSPKRLESELTWIEQQTGGKPYGVDLLLPPKYVGGVDGKQARELLVRCGIPVPADTSSNTVRSRSLTGKPARMLRIAWTDEWERADSPDSLGMPLQSALIDDPQARINRAAAQPHSKARELATYFVGQVVGLTNKVQPAAAVVLDMVAEFIDAVELLDKVADQ
jgi:NAD(P)H-dependent flavin oxidoreductase YrpB (nitropropane dioxygenase family)